MCVIGSAGAPPVQLRILEKVVSKPLPQARPIHSAENSIREYGASTSIPQATHVALSSFPEPQLTGYQRRGHSRQGPLDSFSQNKAERRLK